MENSTLPFMRPLRLGELLDQAIRIYRRNFVSFIGILALAYIPYALLTLFSSWLSLSSGLSAIQATSARNPFALFSSPGYWLSIVLSLVSGAVYLILLNGIATSALVNNILRNQLGQKTGILDSYRQIGPFWWKITITLILYTLLMLAAFVWLIVPCVGWISGLGLIFFLGTIVGQILPAIVIIEKMNGIEAITRAWDMARRRFWWLVGFAIIFALFNILVVLGPTYLVRYLLSSLVFKSASLDATVMSTMIASIVSAVLHLLILPIQITAWTLVYFDLRIRSEGFDLAVSALDPASENLVEDIANIPPAPGISKWLNGDDIGRFVIISLVGLGAYALIVGIVFIITYASISALR